MKRSMLGVSTFFIVLLYCALLVAGNYFIYQQQKDGVYKNFEEAQAIELKLLAELSTEGLITQNYAFIEWFFKHWGREYHKVVSLSLENTQGYSLVNYRRGVSAEAEMLVSSKNLNMHDGTYVLKISTDTIGLERKLDELLLQLFLVSSGAMVLLIILLWFVFHKFAVGPLTEEIRRRRKAEHRLQALEAEN